MTNRIASLLDFVKKSETKFIDFRFTSVSGAFLHITRHLDSINEGVLMNGISFDSSSVPGWKDIHNSDMLLVPDLDSSTPFIDPFTAQPTLCVLCEVREIDNSSYNRDPRFTLKKAENFLKKSGIADKALFGFEMEFFVFDDVRFAIKDNGSFFELDSSEGIYNSGRRYEYNNQGHRSEARNRAYCTSQPKDTLNDIRAEILETLREIKVRPLIHHHEVASSQCEIGFSHGTGIDTADNVQKCKYVTHNVAASYGKSATFMPKPFKDTNGSGMHIHHSLWKNEENLFSDSDGKSISDIAKHYIAGVIKYGRALNALCNPLTNSYKRLMPGYEAPTELGYAFSSRMSAIRIPHSTAGNVSAKRIELRFPDAGANPYLATGAIIMAGIAGIKEKLTPEEAVKIVKEKSHNADAALCKSLEESLLALDKERSFLLEGSVFTDEQLDAYINLKMKDVDEIAKHPTPIEFLKYYGI